MIMAVLVASHSMVDLLRGLENIDITVPRRSFGRSHEQKEKWVICRLFSSLAYADLLTYPLTIEVAAPPNPDFIISMDSMQVGVEVIEATSEIWSEFLDYQDRTESDGLIEPASFRPGGLKRPRKRADRIAMMEAEASKGRLSSPGWSGNTPEQEWADYIIEAVTRKVDAASRYRLHCERLWLAVYVNAPLPSVGHVQALELLRSKLPESWSSELGFNALYILSRDTIVCVERDSHTIVPVHNLWRDLRADN